MDIQQIAFVIVLLVTTRLAVRSYGRVIRNIKLGRDTETADPADEGTRWKNVLLIAFGQKKMFKRPIVALLHGAIYVAFLFTQIELLEILIDGLCGVHRFFAPALGALYTVIISVIELLSLLALGATVIFLFRRNVKGPRRLHQAELDGWPKLDANLILALEILLIIGIFTMNMADSVLQDLDPAHYPDTGTFLLSGHLGPLIMGGWQQDLLVVMERAGWWLHIMIVFCFLLYLPISKHLHILFAFPNTYFAKLQPAGTMENMPEVMTEVKSMLGLTAEEAPVSEELPEFGANDVTGLTWKNIMDSYTCTECGRCTSVCPANITGKKLSPRKIVMDVRDRATEIGACLDSMHPKYISDEAKQNNAPLAIDNFDDGKSLFDYISREELHACTTCNACVEACPVMIDPLDIILQLRRYEILTESAGPADWLPMFNSLENSGAVWQMNIERDAWTKDLEEKS